MERQVQGAAEMRLMGRCGYCGVCRHSSKRRLNKKRDLADDAIRQRRPWGAGGAGAGGGGRRRRHDTSEIWRTHATEDRCLAVP